MESKVRKLCITQGFTLGVKGLTHRPLPLDVVVASLVATLGGCHRLVEEQHSLAKA